MSEHEGLVGAIDEVHARMCAHQRELLALIAQVDRTEAWRDDGARDTAHWLAMRYGLSHWKAHRWIGAAHALEQLPEVSEALATGRLGVDKVAELTRFATASTEHKLIGWAQEVSCGAIRHRGDLAARAERARALEAEAGRFATWEYLDDGHRFALHAELPAAQGAVVARALQRATETVPQMPGDGALDAPARKADALVALCSARIGSDPDPDRATVIVHAQLEGFSRAPEAVRSRTVR